MDEISFGVVWPNLQSYFRVICVLYKLRDYDFSDSMWTVEFQFSRIIIYVFNFRGNLVIWVLEFFRQ